MKFFAVPNLTSQDVTEVDPTKLAPAEDFPGSKEEFNVWKTLPTTQHCFFNCCEGVTPSARVTQENNPKLLYGLVFEFDSDIDDSMVALIPVNGVAGLLPTWVLRSRFRNGRRLVWEFAEPFFIDHADLADRFIKLFVKEAKVENILPGLDKTGLKLTQYQELGKDWTKVVGSSPVATNLLSLLFFKAAAQKGLKSEGPDIPITAVAAEVEKRWPGRWPGEFSVGARGPLFWVDPYIDRVGAVVGDYGMICFSDRAGAAFRHWGDIFGQDFVRNFYAAQIGAAAENIWFDGTYYWNRLSNEHWAAHKKEDLGDDLQVKFSLKPPQVKEALSVIRNTHRITGTFPFVHCKETLINNDAGAIFLNTSERKVIQPADIDGDWSWIKEYLEHSWQDDEFREIQRATSMAWLQRLYVSAREGDMKAGQANFTVGEQGTGKTLFNYRILGALMGGFTDASAFLLEKTAFNKECAECAVWCVDDNRGGANWEKRAKIANQIKRFASNPFIPYHPKYKDEVTMPWKGRFSGTCNTDEESMQIIPHVAEGDLHKFNFFKCGTWTPDFTDIENRLKKELPFFARDLERHKPPEHVLAREPRYGINAFHHPDILRTIFQQSAEARLAEMLDFAIPLWEATGNEKKEASRWMTATEIRAILDQCKGLQGSMAAYANTRLGTALALLGPPHILGKRFNKHLNRNEYLVNLAPRS